MLSGIDQTGTDTLTHMRVMFATTNTRQTLGFRSWLVLLVISACDVILLAWQHVSFRKIPQWLFVKWLQVQTAASVWWRYVSTLTICDSVCRSDLMFIKLSLSKNLPAVNRIRKTSKLSRADDMTPSVCDPAPSQCSAWTWVAPLTSIICSMYLHFSACFNAFDYSQFNVQIILQRAGVQVRLFWSEDELVSDAESHVVRQFVRRGIFLPCPCLIM